MKPSPSELLLAATALEEAAAIMRPNGKNGRIAARTCLKVASWLKEAKQ